MAKVQRPVLLIGERGTGKELAASRIHFLSQRWGGPLVKLNCAALSPSVLESELFGHEVGAFTGAARRRVGRFEAANGGTLFLDEIGQMPMPVQEKILRVVEYGSFERVGASEPVRVDVRLIGATNADLPAMVADGKFKPDLLDRLSFEVLFSPGPARTRGGGHRPAGAAFCVPHGVGVAAGIGPGVRRTAHAALRGYAWPGNVRELKNVVERAVSRADGETIREIVFDPFRRSGAPAKPFATAPVPGVSTDLPVNLLALVADLEQKLLQQALMQARYKQREAAALLGLSYDQFRGLYRKYQDVLKEPACPADS